MLLQQFHVVGICKAHIYNFIRSYKHRLIAKHQSKHPSTCNYAIAIHNLGDIIPSFPHLYCAMLCNAWSETQSVCGLFVTHQELGNSIRRRINIWGQIFEEIIFMDGVSTAKITLCKILSLPLYLQTYQTLT